MKGVKFNHNFFDSGHVRYAAGRIYREDHETLRCIARGIAESVEIEIAENGDLVEKVAAPAQKPAAKK